MKIFLVLTIMVLIYSCHMPGNNKRLMLCSGFENDTITIVQNKKLIFYGVVTTDYSIGVAVRKLMKVQSNVDISIVCNNLELTFNPNCEGDYINIFRYEDELKFACQLSKPILR